MQIHLYGIPLFFLYNLYHFSTALVMDKDFLLDVLSRSEENARMARVPFYPETVTFGKRHVEGKIVEDANRGGAERVASAHEITVEQVMIDPKFRQEWLDASLSIWSAFINCHEFAPWNQCPREPKIEPI